MGKPRIAGTGLIAAIAVAGALATGLALVAGQIIAGDTEGTVVSVGEPGSERSAEDQTSTTGENEIVAAAGGAPVGPILAGAFQAAPHAGRRLGPSG